MLDCLDLHFQLLEAPLIIKNYVIGDVACNYEKYLIEIINASSWFSKNFKEPFVHTKAENRGQCDAYSDIYGLDFKLIASKTMLQAKHIFSVQIDRIMDGAYAYHQSNHKGIITATRFPQAFRGITIEEIQEIRNKSSKKQGLENDINNYMSKLETKKNLLLFFPFRFHYAQKEDLLEAALSVIELCNKDFGVTLDYRAQILPEFDTYFVIIYDNYFILSRWIESRLLLLDTVPIDRSKTFMHLITTYCNGWSSWNYNVSKNQT